MYYVYFLRLNNGDIYTGFTEDLKRRIPEHKKGKVKSTKNYLPCVLIGYEAYLEKQDASRREKSWKDWVRPVILTLSNDRATGRHIVPIIRWDDPVR